MMMYIRIYPTDQVLKMYTKQRSTGKGNPNLTSLSYTKSWFLYTAERVMILLIGGPFEETGWGIKRLSEVTWCMRARSERERVFISRAILRECAQLHSSDWLWVRGGGDGQHDYVPPLCSWSAPLSLWLQDALFLFSRLILVICRITPQHLPHENRFF